MHVCLCHLSELDPFIFRFKHYFHFMHTHTQIKFTELSCCCSFYFLQNPFISMWMLDVFSIETDGVWSKTTRHCTNDISVNLCVWMNGIEITLWFSLTPSQTKEQCCLILQTSCWMQMSTCEYTSAKSDQICNTHTHAQYIWKVDFVSEIDTAKRNFSPILFTIYELLMVH